MRTSDRQERTTGIRSRRMIATPTIPRVACLLCLFFPISSCAFTINRSSCGVKSSGIRILGQISTRRYSSLVSDESDNSNINESQLLQSVSSQSKSTSSMTMTEPFVGLPSYGRIIHFSATTFLVWVSEPLLSLVDSVAVGRYAGKSIVSSSSSLSSLLSSSTGGAPNLSSVIQLAALGPATTLCDSSIYLMLCISMATTNKLANAFAKRDIREQIQTLSHVLGLSLAAGIFLLLFVNLRGMSLLASILGPAGATVSIETATKGIMKSIDLTPEVLHASFGYVRIRSIASPLAIMGLTSQAALLAAQDTRTPVLAVMVASAVNIIGDYIFVAKMGWGIRGASLATCMASIMSNGMLVTKVWKMMGKMKYSYRQEMMMEASSGSELTLQSSNDAHDALASNKNGDSAAEIPFISCPDRKSFVSLLGLVGPMFFVMLFKICGYSAMTIRSGDFGMLSLACHSVMMRVFFFFATAGDAISQAAQTFLPGLLYQKSVLMSEASSVTNPDLRTLLKRLLLISSVVGIVNCFAGRIVALNSGRTFSNDAALVLLMSTVSPFMGLASLLHPFAMCLEGSIIAASDTKFLVGTYIASLFVLLTQLKFICQDFLGVWRCLLVFQLLRMSQFGLRVWKQTQNKANAK